MNPTDPTNPTNTTPPTPADDQPVSDVARRVGPPLAIGSLVLTAALLAWLAMAPTAIAGPLQEAPFTVPATLVLPPDDAGCLRLVAGDGTSREHCIDELARTTDEEYRYIDAYFDEQGRLVVTDDHDDGRRRLYVDTETGGVSVRVEETPFDEPVEGSEEGPVLDPTPGQSVYTDGDRVLRSDDGDWDPDTGVVVLDLDGPPGYRLDQAALSPDGEWVVVLTGAGEIAVGPTDGSAAPHVWVEAPDDRWVDLARSIRWER